MIDTIRIDPEPMVPFTEHDCDRFSWQLIHFTGHIIVGKGRSLARLRPVCPGIAAGKPIPADNSGTHLGQPGQPSNQSVVLSLAGYIGQIAMLAHIG